jgi:hypothetical protein
MNSRPLDALNFLVCRPTKLISRLSPDKVIAHSPDEVRADESLWDSIRTIKEDILLLAELEDGLRGCNQFARADTVTGKMPAD